MKDESVNKLVNSLFGRVSMSPAVFTSPLSGYFLVLYVTIIPNMFHDGQMSNSLTAYERLIEGCF